MPLQAPDEEATPDSHQVVALYDFDPETIDWPFKRQRPLALKCGRVIQVIGPDDDGDWALGHPVGQPDLKGYFPRNYTVSLAEYNDMMRDYELTSAMPRPPSVDPVLEPRVVDQPPATSSLPQGPLPGLQMGEVDADATMMVADPYMQEPAEVAYPGVADYPVLEPAEPVKTTFELTKSRLLADMPAVPRPAPEEPGPPEDDLAAALLEEQREATDRFDVRGIPGGHISDSRASTPGTYAMTRPERDFVRRHISLDMQSKFLKELAPLDDVLQKTARKQREEKPPYTADLRARHTTYRVAQGIEPPHMRMALNNSLGTGARWLQLFRPGFNDIVNESFKMGCNACILSDAYLNDAGSRELFQKLHVRDINGTLWFELQRKKQHLFYMRMDFVDVMMCHPDAWGFPDASHVVSANPGEPYNPFHGWLAQTSIDTDKEMEDVEFLYTLRNRYFPEQTFAALSLGKIPDWIQPFMSLHGEAQIEEVSKEEGAAGNQGTADAGRGKAAVSIDKTLLREAGLEEGEEVYVKLDEQRLARERTVGADVLELEMQHYRLKGLSSMRIFLRSRGNPDNTKQTLISPKMVKDMAEQLGIRGDASHYWYCMFALRYPLAPQWEAVVRNDTRLYLHLPSDRLQAVHPMIKKFREHLNDWIQNEFLWDYRGFVKMKCSQCGIPDAVVWCPQCTDYYCAMCFLDGHRTNRGKKHWPMPVPGSRYLSSAEATKLDAHLPLLNVGFSNRRRFLARDNQSDKNGSRSGDTWLYFHADTFQAALVQCPKDHWFLKRLNPPRLAPDMEGYYYNFGSDVIADDSQHIMMKTHEQKALSLLQKTIRGTLTRRRIKRETAAAVVIQKTRVMLECRRVHGKNGKNANLLRSWYRKFKAAKDRLQLVHRVCRAQACARGMMVRKLFRDQMYGVTRFQAAFRGLRGRRHIRVIVAAATCIQRNFRGRIYGRKPMRDMMLKASRIQALARGVAVREQFRKQAQALTYIAAHVRGHLGRLHVKKMHNSCSLIQRNWRRFQAQLTVKIRLFERLEDIRLRRQEIIRTKLEDSAAVLIQRNLRRYQAQKNIVLMRREKGEADKRTSTVLVALFTAVAGIRNFVHPWFRHLPVEQQEVLEQIKASLQRTIALVPVTGKIANEEIGRGGVRVREAKNLQYDQTGQDPDLASHMLLSVTRNLLSHVPADLFPPAVKWTCYAVGHHAAHLASHSSFVKEVIPVGKEMPPHPGDSLATLWQDMATIKHHHDYIMTTADESQPLAILHGIPAHLRHVYLTAEVLITMRQALDSPSLSTEDHLKFQGLDVQAGAQLMEVIASEMDHRLPLDWPKTHGTVASLVAQMGVHVLEQQPVQRTKPKQVEKKGAKSKAKAKKGEAGQPKKGKDKDAKGLSVPTPIAEKTAMDEHLESGLMHFNRNAMMRILQQVGYFMRDQDTIVNSILELESVGSGLTKGNTQGVRQSRYIQVTRKLFEMADRAKHDHCPFVLSVVLYHLVLRSLMLRVLYHRAAVTLQKRYRYLKQKGKRANSYGPSLMIQRCWRGLRSALRIYRMDNAAEKIQHSYKVWIANRRNQMLITAVLRLQRVWRGAIQRKWLRRCQKAATIVQKHVRGHLIRCSLDKVGRSMMRKSRAELETLKKSKGQLSDTLYMAKAAVIAGKARVEMHKNRERNLDLKRMASMSLRQRHSRKADKAKKLKMKGAIQPQRQSVFEPMVFALARLEPQRARYGVPKSRVLSQVDTVKRALDRTLPRESARPPHTAAKRGRAAMVARRISKRLRETGKSAADVPMVDGVKFNHWLSSHFAPSLP
mmetsp:Transcript_33036/g.77241  ORF Transcript_33036/g.77241 Transcript_33036/m.77241 type:complete len:1793 (+) Transcript_33036:44-5422(+)